MPHLSVPISDSDHCLGLLDAPATLVEYGDYQCHVCRMTVPIIKLLQKELGEKLCIVFRHFPMQQTHPNAKIAAEAAEAAAKQNHFWEMHDLLYKNQMNLSPWLFHQLAEQLQLNVEKFESDLKSSAVNQKIDSDFSAGVRSGVNGIPCFYINGKRYDGDPSYESLKESLIMASKEVNK